MQSRNQYLLTLIKQNGGYHLKSKKEKSKLLDEFCENTGMNRDYIIRKIRSGKIYPDRSKKQQRIRKKYYDRYVTVALILCWEIFDLPCGQRLERLLKTEVDRLRNNNELKCSNETASKLKQISARTIDECLKSHKEKEHLKLKYQHNKIHPLLYQKIPVKISIEWDRDEIGNIQTDLVEHCGSTIKKNFIYTLSNTDIATGWWEGEAIMGKSRYVTRQGIEYARQRFPFNIKGIHSDNGSEFINWHLFGYTVKEEIDFSRSRPYQKNDNCFVEQKNWTHVRRKIGYLRYDTQQELNILNDLYRNEYRLYKNFFQPVMKLTSKERIGAKVKRKYETKTPYQRLMESNEISIEKKRELKRIYESLNPAELKRAIDIKLDKLYKTYQAKQRSTKIASISKQLKPSSLTFLNCTTNGISPT